MGTMNVVEPLEHAAKRLGKARHCVNKAFKLMGFWGENDRLVRYNPETLP
jgi:hypothetical protein